MKVLQNQGIKIAKTGEWQHDIVRHEPDDVESLAEKFAEFLEDGIPKESKKTQDESGGPEDNTESDGLLEKDIQAEQQIGHRFFAREIKPQKESDFIHTVTSEEKTPAEKPLLDERLGRQFVDRGMDSQKEIRSSREGIAGSDVPMPDFPKEPEESEFIHTVTSEEKTPAEKPFLDERLGRQVVDRGMDIQKEIRSFREGIAGSDVPMPDFPKEPAGQEGEQVYKTNFGQHHIKESKQQKLYEPAEDPADAVISQLSRFSINIGSQSSTPSVDNVQTTSSAELIPELVRKMVDRILVEVPGTSHKQEVRIRLSQDILPDTDIRIFREGGRLEVHFVTGSRESSDFVSPHLASLKDALESRQGEPVNVSLQYTGEGRGDQSQGRSRQRRTVWDEYENF
ncbi:MAG: type III secretion HpaP family protein [Thermodesulforhabdaceae bacterium]|jgi:type III secretion system needle length determinant